MGMLPLLSLDSCRSSIRCGNPFSLSSLSSLAIGLARNSVHRLRKKGDQLDAEVPRRLETVRHSETSNHGEVRE